MGSLLVPVTCVPLDAVPLLTCSCAVLLCASVLLQTAGSGKRKRAAAAGSAAGGEESGQSGGLSDDAETSEEGTSGVKPKPGSAKKRVNPRKPSHPMRSAIDEGSTGSDAKKVRNICTV